MTRMRQDRDFVFATIKFPRALHREVRQFVLDRDSSIQHEVIMGLLERMQREIRNGGSDNSRGDRDG